MAYQDIHIIVGSFVLYVEIAVIYVHAFVLALYMLFQFITDSFNGRRMIA